MAGVSDAIAASGGTGVAEACEQRTHRQTGRSGAGLEWTIGRRLVQSTAWKTEGYRSGNVSFPFLQYLASIVEMRRDAGPEDEGLQPTGGGKR